MQRSRPLLEDEDSDDEEEEEAEGRRRHLRLSQEYEQMGGQAGRWSCASCSFINGVLLRTCQVCGHPKDHRMYQEEDRNTRSCAFSWEVFGSLADEVMLCVFSHLNLEGLCRVSSVCRRWRRLADDDSLWRSLLYRVMPQADAEDCDMAPEDGTAKIPRRSAIYYNTASGRRLKAASLNKLIDLITPVGDETGSHFSAGDINEQKAFLATYLSFTTPEKLLVKLVHLYLRVCEKAKLLKDNQSNSGTTVTDTKGRGGVSGEAALADETKRRSASGSGSLLQTPGNNHWAPYTAGPTAKTRKASLIGNKEKKEDQTSSGNGNGNGDEEASNAEIAPSPRTARGAADFEEVGAGDRPGPTQQRYQQEASPAVTLTEKDKGKEKETDEKEKERAPTWLSAHLPEAEATEEKDRAHPDDQQAALTSLLSASGEDITTRLRSRSTGFTASRRTSQGREGEIYLAEWRLKDKTKAASRTWEAKADADSATINFSDLGPEQHQGHVGSSSDNSADRLRWNSAAHATTKEVPAALPQLYSTSLPTSGPLSTCSSWSSGSVPTRPASFSSAMTHDPDPIQTLPLPSPPPSSHVLPRRERPNEIFAKQVRICSLLKKWIEQHFADFSPRVIFLMKVFIRGTIIRERNPMNAPLANSIVLSLSKKLRQGSGHSTDPANASIFMELPPEPVVPSNVCSPLLSLFDVPPIEVARQLTLIEFSRFKAIKMSEFFGQLWSRSPGSLKDKAPNVMAMINAFNEFCTWVAASIVTQERIKDRVKTMEYFVQTAKNLYRLKNFNTLMALLAGLRSESVYRLTYTRAEISRKSEKTLENLNMLMRGDNAYKCYREALAQSAPPCIPYLGVHLSDLTFIEDGNPDLIEGLINFTKRRLVFRVISELSRYQQAEYNLHPVPQVMALLKREGSRFGRHGPSSSPPGPEDLYRLSERREPRGAERKDLL